MTQTITRRQFATAALAVVAPAAVVQAHALPRPENQAKAAALDAGARFLAAVQDVLQAHGPCKCKYCEKAAPIATNLEWHLASLSGFCPMPSGRSGVEMGGPITCGLLANDDGTEPSAAELTRPEAIAVAAGHAFSRAITRAAKALGVSPEFSKDALAVAYATWLYTLELSFAWNDIRRPRQDTGNHPLAEAAVIAGYRFHKALLAAGDAHSAQYPEGDCDCMSDRRGNSLCTFEPMAEFIWIATEGLAAFLLCSGIVQAAKDAPFPAEVAPRSSPEQRAVVAGAQLCDALDAVLETDWNESKSGDDAAFWDACWHLQWLAGLFTDLLGSFVGDNSETASAIYGADSPWVRYAAKEAGDVHAEVAAMGEIAK